MSLLHLSNCWIWSWIALFRLGWMYNGRRVHRSYRKSDYGWFPHYGIFIQRRNGSFRFVSYKPKSPRKRLLPPPLFSGKVTWGD